MNYLLNTENLLHLINLNCVSYHEPLNFDLEDSLVSIRKAFINEDGEPSGNYIYISKGNLEIFIKVDDDNPFLMYSENESGFTQLINTSPQYAIDFVNDIWPKIIVDMQEREDAWNGVVEGLSWDEFKSQFGNYKIPNDLKMLFEFDKKTGNGSFTDCFCFTNFDKSGLKSWSDNEQFYNSFIEFAKANGSGSSYAYWLIDADLEKCPIVIFGDEGGIYIVAKTTKELIHLLTYDTEISVSYDDGIYFYKDEDDYEESENRPAFLLWAKKNFKLNAIQNEEESTSIVSNAQQEFQEPLNKFLSNYIPSNVEEQTNEPVKFQRIKFPNSCGFTLPQMDQANNLQSIYHFSDDYKHYLLSQNGFIEKDFSESDNKEQFLVDADETTCWQDFKALYGITNKNDHYDLIENQTYNIFKNIFFVIGTDHAGNEFVEVLKGQYKGYIGVIDHEQYASTESIETFFENMELGNYRTMTETEIVNTLTDQDLGLINFHAKTMNDFLENNFILSNNAILIKELD